MLVEGADSQPIKALGEGGHRNPRGFRTDERRRPARANTRMASAAARRSGADSTWCLLLDGLPGGRTRMVESGYWRLRPRCPQPVAGFLFIEGQHCVMQPRQFANLNRRITRDLLNQQLE